ncbi:MAG: NTP transferase domain-containing protein [Caulobacter sp.]|nr:NTP transferase domain-containing protein [Caulobacter sp.]
MTTPTSSPRIAGLVLAGGRSRRFGAEKAAALLRGQPLLDWSLSALRPDCAVLAVNAPEGSAAAALAKAGNHPLLADAPGTPDGPLSGVAAGLAWALDQQADWLLTAPCDTPRLPADLARRLLAAAGEGPGASAVSPDGRQPLCALWRPALLAPLTLALAAGHPPVRAFQDEAGMALARFEDSAAFVNFNTPDEQD